MKNVFSLIILFLFSGNSFAQTNSVSADEKISELKDQTIIIEQMSGERKKMEVTFEVIIEHFSYVNNQLRILKEDERKTFLACMQVADERIQDLYCSKFKSPVAPHSQLIEAARYVAKAINETSDNSSASLTEQFGIYSFVFNYQNKSYPLF